MNTRKKVNRLITIVMIAIFIIIAIVINASAQINTGYLVSVDYKDKMIIRKVKTAEQVNEILLQRFPMSKLDIKELMKGGIYLEMWGSDMRIYVELKRIDKKGKFRRLSKKEIKQIEN